MEQNFLVLNDVNVQLGAHHLLKNIHLEWRMDQQWALFGASGSGKTTLANVIAGKQFFSGQIQASFGDNEHFHRMVNLIPQQHRFKNTTNGQHLYYQQRYNASDASETLTVAELIKYSDWQHVENFNGYNSNELLEMLHLQHVLFEPLIQLSNGENKRLQLMQALMKKQDLLIMDQPFIGLDKEGRSILQDILLKMTDKGIKILLISAPGEIPPCFTNRGELSEGRLIVGNTERKPHIGSAEAAAVFLHSQLAKFRKQHPGEVQFSAIVKMVDVNITYDERKILQHINWTITQGEKCSLSGPNGAGKSTLLSLITADHPQSYANEIYLFDRRRGTGESIWDIKKRIGYVSPELHLYFPQETSVFDTVASGLFDTIGLFRLLNQEQTEEVLLLLNILQLGHLLNRRFAQLSAGQQRLVLLARALIKNPLLLILDEPCQGLDETATSFFKMLIDDYCKIIETTLIYVSHYSSDVPSCVHRFVQMNDGIMSERQ